MLLWSDDPRALPPIVEQHADDFAFIVRSLTRRLPDDSTMAALQQLALGSRTRLNDAMTAIHDRELAVPTATLIAWLKSVPPKTAEDFVNGLATRFPSKYEAVFRDFGTCEDATLRALANVFFSARQDQK